MAKEIVLSNQLQTATGALEFNMTNDIMFKMVLQREETVLRGLISSMMHIPLDKIYSVHIENPAEFKDSPKDRVFVLDVKVTLNSGTIINIEMQNWNERNWKNRSLSYLCRNFDKLQRGEDFNSVSPVIHIGFLGYDLFPESPEFYAFHKLLNIKTHSVYNDNFVMNVLSLNQINLATKEDKEWEIDQWARLFKAATYEEVKMLAKQNEAFSKAAEQMVLINSDEIERERMLRREEAIFHERYVREKMERLESSKAELEAENAALKAELAKLKTGK